MSRSKLATVPARLRRSREEVEAIIDRAIADAEKLLQEAEDAASRWVSSEDYESWVNDLKRRTRSRRGPSGAGRPRP